MRPITTAARISSSGTETAMSQLRPTLVCTAKMMPPIASSGAVTSMVAPIIASICTCCTSFVLRVMSEPAPNCETSRSEKPLTLPNTSARMSRPAPIAARAAKYVAVTEAMICPSETASMNRPVLQMYAVSPRAMPLSMMSAFRRGTVEGRRHAGELEDQHREQQPSVSREIAEENFSQHRRTF